MANDPSAHTFSSSTVMSYSNGPDGNPQVYHATKSTRTGPGGVSSNKTDNVCLTIVCEFTNNFPTVLISIA